ncbi:MAG: PA-phosphatase [Bacteroidota bacterium]|nr:PA-phosphatase [Bacteroidota bacterium]
MAWIYILVVVIAFALSDHITSEYFKSFFYRLRPCHNHLMHARLLLENCGGNWGFPSTHASNHMAMALTIILADYFISRWIKILFISWALLIGFAQVYVGVHYPADIAGGYLFGIIVALFVNFAVFPLLKKLHHSLTRQQS